MSKVTVTTAVTQRRSTRDYLPKSVPLSMVQEILNLALRSPSGGNTQPWKIYVVAGGNAENVVVLFPLTASWVL